MAVVGSGPAGLAAAQQLNRAGHWVTVFERADRIGGLLRYGIPEFKLEKRVLDRRLDQLRNEGIRFRVNAHIGRSHPVDELLAGFDALLLAGGSTVPRSLTVAGRDLEGVHFAVEYLTAQNRVLEGDLASVPESLSAAGKRVIIIGGGDTGSDCLGTVHRQRALSVTQLELLPRPPDSRAPENPWPQWPMIFRSSAAHEEGGTREYSVSTTHLSGENGRLRALHGHRLERAEGGGPMAFRKIPGTEFTLEADLILLAMGFMGPEPDGVISQLGLRLTDRGNVARDEQWMTNVPGVFVAGDMQRGQSLIVWAIADGRKAAEGVHRYLSAS